MSNPLIESIGQGQTLQEALANYNTQFSRPRYDFQRFTADFLELLQPEHIRSGTLTLRCGRLDLLCLSGSQWREICAIAAKTIDSDGQDKGTVLQCGVKRAASVCRRIRSFYLDVIFQAIQHPAMCDSATALFRKGRVLARDLQAYSSKQLTDDFFDIRQSLETNYRACKPPTNRKPRLSLADREWMTEEELERLLPISTLILEKYDLQSSKESVVSFVASVPLDTDRTLLLDLTTELLFPYADKENRQVIRLAHILKELDLTEDEVEIVRISCSRRPYRTLAILFGTLNLCQNRNQRKIFFELIPLLLLLPSSKSQHELILSLNKADLSSLALRVFTITMIPLIEEYGPIPHLCCFKDLQEEQLTLFYEFLGPLFKLCPTVESAMVILDGYKWLPQEKWVATRSLLEDALGTLKSNANTAPEKLCHLFALILTDYWQENEVDNIYASICNTPPETRQQILKEIRVLQEQHKFSSAILNELIKAISVALSTHGNCDLISEAAFLFKQCTCASAAKHLEYLLKGELSSTDLQAIKRFIEVTELPSSSLELIELFASIRDLNKRTKILASLRLFVPFLQDKRNWQTAIQYAIEASEKENSSLFDRVYMVISACKEQKEITLEPIFDFVINEHEQTSDEAFATLIASATPFLQHPQYNAYIPFLINLSPYLHAYSLNEEPLDKLQIFYFREEFLSTLFKTDQDYLSCGKALLADLESGDCDKIDNALRFIYHSHSFVSDLTPPIREKIGEVGFIKGFKRQPLKTICMMQRNEISTKREKDLQNAFLAYYPEKEGEELWKGIEKSIDLLKTLEFLFEMLEPKRLNWTNQEISWHAYAMEQLAIYRQEHLLPTASAANCRIS